MTSRSLRNRPTTAWRTIRRATATSLALLAGAGAAAAQAPQWDTTAPSKTQWAQFPVQPTAAKPVPPVEAPIGTRVVLFQKPAEVPGEPKLAEPKVDPKPPDSMPPDTKITEATRDEVFRMERKDVFKMSGDDDIQGKPSKVLDPKKAPPTPPPYQSRTGTTPPMRMLLEPGYVVHRRLYFEERNAERYGWDLGLVQPVVSLAYFYKDVLLYPAKLGSNRRERYDTNAGKYLPGAPVPYYLYPPEITLAGVALGAGVIIGTAVLLQ